MTTDEEAISNALLSVLGDGKAMDFEQMEIALRARGVDLGDDPDEALEDALESDDFLWIVDLPGERMVLLPALLDGRMLTHRLTEVECEYDVLEIAPDFQPMAELLEDGEIPRLQDGTPLEVMPTCTCEDHVLHRDRGIPGGVLAEGGALLLPLGHLAAQGAVPGDLVGVRFTVAGLDIVRVADGPEAADSMELTDAIAEALEQRHALDAPMSFNAAMWTAMAEGDDLFRTPTAPLSEALDGAGFTYNDRWLAPPDVDLVQWSAQQRVRGIELQFNLSAGQAQAVGGLLGLFDQVADLVAEALVSHIGQIGEDSADGQLLSEEALATAMTETRLAIADLLNSPVGARDDARPGGIRSDQGSVRGLLRDFTDPAAAEALVWSAIGPDADDSGALVLAALADALESHAPRAALANLRWTQAKACERFGQILTAESLLREAFDVDSD
ncbi:MAG: hypothetical protein WCI74_12035, partial [Actinomycetes bacterium]